MLATKLGPLPARRGRGSSSEDRSTTSSTSSMASRCTASTRQRPRTMLANNPDVASIEPIREVHATLTVSVPLIRGGQGPGRSRRQWHRHRRSGNAHRNSRHRRGLHPPGLRRLPGRGLQGGGRLRLRQPRRGPDGRSRARETRGGHRGRRRELHRREWSRAHTRAGARRRYLRLQGAERQRFWLGRRHHRGRRTLRGSERRRRSLRSPRRLQLEHWRRRRSRRRVVDRGRQRHRRRRRVLDRCRQLRSGRVDDKFGGTARRAITVAAAWKPSSSASIRLRAADR